MLCLFERLSFSPRLKLILYEILSSLKSYTIYIATSDSEHVAAENHNVRTPLISRHNSENIHFSGKNQTFEIPKELLRLPPLQVSSFISKPTESKDSTGVSLGITPMSHERESTNGDLYNEDEKEKWFIFDKKSTSYISKLKTQAYCNINSYKTYPDQVKSINNACYNLALFDASFKNKNPV